MASMEPTPDGEDVAADELAGLSLEPTDDDEGQRTIVMVGVTGDGKSTTANTLCGTDAFDTSTSFGSETAEAAHADYLQIGAAGCFEWRVVDTVGLQDTDLSAEEVMARFSAFSDHVPLGINVFLFVARYGRWKPEHEAAMDAFVRNCGEAALGHTLLVFTSCKLGDDELQRQLAEHAPKSLARLLDNLAGPAVGLDNVGDPQGARSTLQAAVDAACAARPAGRRRYTNAALAEARLRHDTRQEEERAAFAAAVSDWRKRDGPLVVEREAGAEGGAGGAGGAAGAEETQAAARSDRGGDT